MLNDNMNHRLIVALAVVLPIAIFGAAKITASWRPVKVDTDVEGVVSRSPDSSIWQAVPANADSDLVRQSGAVDQLRLFSHSNLGLPLSNKSLEFFNSVVKPNNGDLDWSGVTTDGVWKWHIKWGDYLIPDGGQDSIVIGDEKRAFFLSEGDSTPVRYPIPSYEISGTFGLISVSPSDNRVDLVLSGHYLRWNKKSTKLERNIVLPPVGRDQRSDYIALSRDGKTLIQSVSLDIRTISTRTGRILKTLPTHGSAVALSPFGNYALYRTASIIDTHTGRELWRFDMETMESHIVFSSDETLVAIPFAYHKQWEIRDLKTGQLLRTLPLLPGVTNGQFSPNNSTLYSIYNGVLYRQRAR